METQLKKLENVKRVTNNVLELTSNVALFLEKNADSLPSSFLNGKYSYRHYKTNNGIPYTDFCLNIHNQYHEITVSLSCDCVSSNRENYIRNGDFNATYNEPCRDDILTFISDLPAIFAEINNNDMSDALTNLQNFLKITKELNK